MLVSVSSSLLAQTFGQGKYQGPTPEQQQELLRQNTRFQALVKANKLDEAERALVVLASIEYRSLSQWTRDAEVAGKHAAISLRRRDYVSAFADLKNYFEGGPGHGRKVGGATDMRVWYWFLLAQRGDLVKAQKVQDDLFRDSVYNPSGGGVLFDPVTTSKSKLSQVYLFMAARKVSSINLYRSHQYLILAQRVDPSVKIDSSFEKFSNRFGFEKGVRDPHEEQELIPALDHTVFEKAQGKRIRNF